VLKPASASNLVVVL